MHSLFHNQKRESTTKQKRFYWLKLLLLGLIWGLLLLAAGYLALYVDALTRPLPSDICCTTPAKRGFDYEDVTLSTADGVTLSGWYIPSRNGAAVILLHGDGGNRVGMLAHARMLAQHGYGVLLYDQRACGQSGGEMRTYGWLDAGDVQAATDYLHSREDVKPGQIGILGVSLGGQIALRAAAQNKEIGAVVADGPGTVGAADVPFSAEYWRYFLFNWAVDRVQELRTGVVAPAGVVEVIGDITPRPILLIATGQTVRVEGWEYFYTRRLYEAAGQPKTLWQIPEAGHGAGLAARPQEYEDRVVAFFDSALLKDQSER
jgi:pimeloyl-ACP methyl ester carboxylesterase